MSQVFISEKSPEALTDVQLIRLPVVLGTVPVSRSTWLEGVKAGRYPQPVRIGRTVAWRAADIRTFISTL